MVKIYSKKDCPFAFMAKKWFNNKNIKFEEFELTSSEKSPMILIGEEKIYGYMDLIKKETYVMFLLGFELPKA